jgi:hypothetical protein
MTFGRLFAATFPRSAVTIAAVVSVAASLAGCGTAGMTDAMAVVAQPRLPAPGSATYAQNSNQQTIQQTGAATNLDATAPRPGSEAPRVSGAYPNLNIRPGAAAAQLTPEESKAMLADLRSTQTRLAGSNARAARSVPSADELRRIGAAHGDSTLKEIASQSQP